MLSTTIPAIVSVGLNLLLLPKLGYIGAANCICFNRGTSMADTVILYSFLFERGAHSRFIDQNYNLIWSYVWYPTIYKTISKCITNN